jgi:hypothetical protein
MSADTRPVRLSIVGDEGFSKGTTTAKNLSRLKDVRE